MVQERIILGHRISRKWIEVHKGKIEVIDKLPLPTLAKGIRNFLEHAGFCRRFIKDSSKISKPLCMLLKYNKPFNFYEDCLKAFVELKRALVTIPIVVAPDWIMPFELMCDANDHSIGVVLG